MHTESLLGISYLLTISINEQVGRQQAEKPAIPAAAKRSANVTRTTLSEKGTAGGIVSIVREITAGEVRGG